jgi:SAM-dependent methyltransferase
MPGEPHDALEELVDVHDRDVLDVGCGEGELVRRLVLAGARVVGLDPLAVALEHARHAGPPSPAARFVEGPAEALPFPGESFDVVIFFNSLHHVPAESMDAALAEAARVLRGGGVLYVQEPLAEGSFFEVVRAVEDETRVRAAAQDALRRATSEGRLVELASREAVITFSLEFEHFCERMVSVDPARGAELNEHGSALRAAFERLGRQVRDGYEFDQPFRANLFGLPT